MSEKRLIVTVRERKNDAMTFSQRCQEKLGAALANIAIADELPDGFIPEITQATNPQFGHYQSNAAMVLAKIAKTNPRALAGEIAEAFDSSDGFCKPLEVAGPGFLNFTLTSEAVEKRVGEMLLDGDQVGVPTVNEPETIVIDFSAPNVAKPMHIGHIRSTIIGDCLSRVSRFLGHKVITDNHIGDWGTQFGMILWGWKNLLDEAALEADPVPELLRIYREVNARQKTEEGLRDTCKAELVKLQAGDEENLKIWQTCIDFSKQGLQKIYDRLDIHFDHWLGESYYNDQLAPLVDELVKAGIATESDGALCVFSDGEGKPEDDPFLVQDRDDKTNWVPFPALVRKADGGFTYATTDLATIDHRIGEFGASQIWYVVGAPQRAHFDQIFETTARRGIDGVELEFIPFGSILGKDRKMLRTRDGETVQLADVLSEAIERARAIIEEKNPDLAEDEKAEIARIIGVGSVKYAELSQHRMTDYVFDWDTMLALKGNTAPYLIYSYVRTRAIFRKLGEDFGDIPETITLQEDAERALALKLAQFAEIVPTVIDDYRPNVLAAYLYEVATAYHKFWEACPVLKVEGDLRASRLAMCELTGRVLRTGLGLLGIETTEKM